MTQRVSFLFGSGVSMPARMPSVSQITEKVLTGTGVMRHTDGNYYFGQTPYAHTGIPDEYIPRIVTFLNRLFDEIRQYYISDPERVVNYRERKGHILNNKY